jgi:hypothetical protein
VWGISNSISFLSMKSPFSPRTLLVLGISAFFALRALTSDTPDVRVIGRVGEGDNFIAFMARGKWGLAVKGAGMASIMQPEPVGFEFYKAPDKVSRRATGYDSLQTYPGGAKATARMAGPDGTVFTIDDRWSVSGRDINLTRKVTVVGAAEGGFLTSITFSHSDAHFRSDVDYFAPGIIYGSVDHLTAAAIGGSETYGTGGHGEIQIREDRLPAPMFGVHFPDGSALTILDPSPDGATTRADSHDTKVATMVDERFKFGAVGVHLADGHQEQGFWFPGTEGEVTYAGNTYPNGQIRVWRRRYHPIRDGFIQAYRVQFRFTNGEEFPAYCRSSWRWAFDTLKPPVTWQNLPLIQKSTIDVLASQVMVSGDRAGIPFFASALPRPLPDWALPWSDYAAMGFSARNMEAASFLLADAQTDRDRVRAARDRSLGLAIFRAFIRLPMNPPAGTGFAITTGKTEELFHSLYLRSFGDDMTATLRAFHRERLSGISHPEWLAWVRQFGDWLLTQQQAQGGFPRAWLPGTGEVENASPESSYNAIPMLVLLSEDTGDARFLKSAERAGDFMWMHGQEKGQFVGGTIDNPNVLDKEAGTLSTAAYLALFEFTKNSKWLDRAKAAADYAETYIYIWNIPMPTDEDDSLLQWKRGVPTVGTQLIATGHSLVDDYMAYDVDEYAKLARWTGDPHYMEIATLLLHNTKNMIALPGRTYDLRGPGWQQEHWSFAPVRGFGIHRVWLPWAPTVQLKGIIELKEFDAKLYHELSSPPARD